MQCNTFLGYASRWKGPFHWAGAFLQTFNSRSFTWYSKAWFYNFISTPLHTMMRPHIYLFRNAGFQQLEILGFSQKPQKVIENPQYHAANLTTNLNLMSCARRTLKPTNVRWQSCVVGMETRARAQLTLPVILERH